MAEEAVRQALCAELYAQMGGAAVLDRVEEVYKNLMLELQGMGEDGPDWALRGAGMDLEEEVLGPGLEVALDAGGPLPVLGGVQAARENVRAPHRVRTKPRSPGGQAASSWIWSFSTAL